MVSPDANNNLRLKSPRKRSPGSASDCEDWIGAELIKQKQHQSSCSSPTKRKKLSYGDSVAADSEQDTENVNPLNTVTKSALVVEDGPAVVAEISSTTASVEQHQDDVITSGLRSPLKCAPKVARRSLASPLPAVPAPASTVASVPASTINTAAQASAQVVEDVLADKPRLRAVRKDKHVFKLLVLGNSKCGKTSFIQRYCNDRFDPSYNITIGADYTKKVVEWDEKTQVRLQLWDIAGQDRFVSLTRPYYRQACAAVVVSFLLFLLSFLSALLFLVCSFYSRLLCICTVLLMT